LQAADQVADHKAEQVTVVVVEQAECLHLLRNHSLQ
jgi:hypothetical protein